MLAAFLMGLVGGQRAMSPLAAVSLAAAGGRLRDAPRFVGHPLAAAGAVVLAIGEFVGDTQKTAPDRIVPVGLLARCITSGLAGACLAPRQRWAGAAVGGTTAMLAAYPGWRLRTYAMRDHGQTSTGLLEDAAVVLAAALILRAAR